MTLPIRSRLAGLLLAFASPAPADDLLDVYRRAEQNDPRFRAATATYRAALERRPQARAGLLPLIEATADATRNDNRVRTDAGIVSRPAGRASFDSTGYTLSLTQPVYNAAVFAGLRQAGAEVRRAEAQFAAARQELITRAAEAYFQVLAAQDGLALAEAEQTAIARQLEVAEGRLEVGLAAITDVHDARARFELAAAQLIEARNLLADRREALRELTGAAPVALAPLADLPLTRPEPAEVDRWVETAGRQNLALAASREAVEIAREEVRRRRAGHFPTLDIVGSRTYTDDEGSVARPDVNVRTDNEAIGLELNLPIFQGGLVAARTAEAAQLLQAAEQELEAAVRGVERATRAAYLGAASGAARVQALTQAVVASESALEAKREGFEAGINSNIDVLDASRDLFRARRDLAAARYDYVLNLMRLKQSAGTLGDEDLVTVNNWLGAR